MAAKDDKKAAAKAAKGKPDAKGKKKDKKGKKDEAADASTVMSVANHPKAGAHVRRAKGWGGLIGFAVAAILSLKASVPVDVVGERALLFGAIGYMIGWASSVTIWRQLMIVELRVAAEQVKAKRAEAAAAQPAVQRKA
jgi:hypothetical protein